MQSCDVTRICTCHIYQNVSLSVSQMAIPLCNLHSAHHWVKTLALHKSFTYLLTYLVHLVALASGFMSPRHCCLQLNVIFVFIYFLVIVSFQFYQTC